MLKITPNLWFDKEAKEAVSRLTKAFLPMKKLIIEDLVKAYEGGE